MYIGEKVKAIREEKGYSQKQLAKVLNISSGALSKYETGKCQIPVDILIRLAELFDVSVDYIVGKTGLTYDYAYINEKYFKGITVGELLNEMLSLEKNHRETLSNVISALYFVNVTEQMKKK